MTIRRLKTYAGFEGYVYQYYFVGKRPLAGEHGASEYVFDVTSDRENTYAVAVVLSPAPVAAWARAHGRSLSDSEQYAAVKMRLFRAFDELPGIGAHGRQWRIDAAFLEEALAALGVD
jgi:hypothetical protein